MGLILDSSVAITSERQGMSAEGLLAAIRDFAGPNEIALSVVSVMELEHGMEAAAFCSSGCTVAGGREPLFWSHFHILTSLDHFA
jgi:predicted nucleic acid-binding protein